MAIAGDGRMILKIERILFKLWYRFYASNKYNNCIKAVIKWNTSTKRLNNLRRKAGDIPSLIWQNTL